VSTRYIVGTSGWHYDHWRDRFYPENLPKSRWLEFYAQHFRAVEVNNSFYRLPSEKAFSNWYDRSPDEFIFAVKASRVITHYRKLRNVEEPLSRLLDHARMLRHKLGPVLYQLPSSLHRDDSVLEDFLAILPSGVKHVVEFRHQSWYDDRVFEILRRHQVGYCVVSMPHFESPFAVTASFSYIRFHGSAALYAGSYSHEEIDRWAKRIHDEARNAEQVFAFFNNDAEANAVYNAQELASKL